MNQNHVEFPTESESDKIKYDDDFLHAWLSKNDVGLTKKFMDSGWTALHLASCYDHVEIVRLLLSNGDIGVNKTTNDNFTALYYAAEYGNVEVVRLLLSQSDIDIEMKNFGMTVLTKLQKYGTKDGSEGHLARQTEIIKLLEIHHRE